MVGWEAGGQRSALPSPSIDLANFWVCFHICHKGGGQNNRIILCLPYIVVVGLQCHKKMYVVDETEGPFNATKFHVL